ncbi:MAG: TonB-dependent receptor [Nitrospinota bacterium]|nr:TonB-dependent receptor [Nitrospinota bacterium]
MFKYLMVFALVTTMYLPGELHAQDTGGNGDPSSEEAALDLLKVFDEATEIATKSKLNADYVPGMVTVLHGKDLQARGVETVWEALALVPGFDLSMQSWSKQIIARGIGNVFASGNVKIMVNSIQMNSHTYGRSFGDLEIPIVQIDRIEVIRGPGSGLYGEYAFTGVVNIITRKEENQAYFRAGSFNTYSGGTSGSWISQDGDLRASLNLAGTTSEGAGVQAGRDALYGLGLGGISNAPGPSNEDKKHVSAILDIGYKDFSLIGQLIHLNQGMLFGAADALPSTIQNRTPQNFTEFMMEANQDLKLLPDLSVHLHAGFWHERTKTDPDHLLYPAGFPGFPNGMVAAGATKEKRAYGGIDFSWKGWEQHSLLLGWSMTWIRLADTSFTANFVPSTSAPAGSVITWRGSESFILAPVDRLLNSVTFQDEYRLFTNLTFTLGLRYDNYDDVGDRLTPRIAGVWQVNDQHILKAQYAQAFRPPTFFEMFGQNNPVIAGNPNISPSVIDTFEVGHIYRKARTVVRTTLYYSILDKLIEVSGGKYQNSGGATQMGVELEWEQEITSQLKLNSNLTLQETKDRETNESVEGSANLLANVGVNYRPMNDLMFNVQYRYIGHRHRAAGDGRENLGGYNNVDFTANWFKPFGGQGWTLRGGVRNLFDEDIYYAAPANTYPADYPRPGINFWAQLSYEF